MSHCLFAMTDLLRLAFVSTLVVLASAWGEDGHHIICTIAKPRLSADALQAIDTLLPNGDFVQLCTWADEVRKSYRYLWSAPLHFADTPDGLCTYEYERDCHNEQGQKDMCVAGAINNYTSQLEMYSQIASSPISKEDAYNLTEALLFISHFMGDIHQPLHVGFTTDLGANTIIVRWYGRKVNLHHVWDTEFITRAELLYFNNMTNMAQSISKNITREDETAWSCKGNEPGCINNYATESINAACKWAYEGASQNSSLDDGYFFSRLPIVEQRLAQGGVRLAAILNNIFASNTPQTRS